MLARMGGHLQGVAKSANPVIVRISPDTQQMYAAFIDGIAKVLDDVGRTKKRAVLSMSFAFPEENASGGVFPRPDGRSGATLYRSAMYQLLRSLASRGVTLVACAGNESKVKSHLTK